MSAPAHAPMGARTLPRPFRITEAHRAARGLEADTLGLWCLPVMGCWHLFASHGEACRARTAFLQGRAPR